MNNQNQEIQVPNFLRRESVERQSQMLEEQSSQRYKNTTKNKVKRKSKRNTDLKRKLVSTAFIAAATLSIAMLASNGHKQFVGGNRITNEFYKYTKGYSMRDDSVAGKIVMINGVEVSFDSAMKDIINDAIYDGMPMVKVSIAMSRLYGKEVAEKYVGEVSSDDKRDAKYQAYYEGKLEEYTKVSGGRSQ